MDVKANSTGGQKEIPGRLVLIRTITQKIKKKPLSDQRKGQVIAETADAIENTERECLVGK